jgi:hypothetical protein
MVALPIRVYFFLWVFFAFFVFFSFAFAFFCIGLPQHHMVVSDAPQASITTLLPQGTQSSFWPFLCLAICTSFVFDFTTIIA